MPNFPIDYSLRRQYVDAYLSHHVTAFPRGGRILDLGGHKIHKRGAFDIGVYDARIVYLDFTSAKHPDVIGDAQCIPFCASTFDGVLCSELLEHVSDPLRTLEEIHRVLRPGAPLLICVPFLFPVHADPHDFGRYTAQYWRTHLAPRGFAPPAIEAHGLFWSVLGDMIRAYAYDLAKQGRPRQRWQRRLLHRLVHWLRAKACAWDRKALEARDAFLQAYTTGYGIRTVKL